MSRSPRSPRENRLRKRYEETQEQDYSITRGEAHNGALALCDAAWPSRKSEIWGQGDKGVTSSRIGREKKGFGGTAIARIKIFWRIAERDVKKPGGGSWSAPRFLVLGAI